MTTTLRFASRKISLCLMLALVLLFTSLWATGASISSTPAGGNWSATTTWVGGIVPGSSDAATIVSGATVTVDILTATCATLDINSGLGGGGVVARLDFNSGTALTVSGTVTIGAAGAGRTGSIIMTNGGLLLVQQFTVTRAGVWTPGTGTVQLTATNTLPATFFGTFNNLDISAGTTTTGRALTINGNLSVEDGATFAVAAFGITVTGTATIGTGTSGIISFSAVAGAKIFIGVISINPGAFWDNFGNSPIEIRGGITNNGTFTSGTGVYTFDTNAQLLTGIISIGSVTVTAIAITNNNIFTVTTVLTGSGSLIQVAGATLNIGGTATVTTLTANSLNNTVNYTGNAQGVKSTNYYHLTLSGSGGDQLPAAASSVAGDLTLSGTVTATTRAALTIGNLFIGDGTILNVAGFAFTVTGTTTIGQGISGTLKVTSPAGAKIFGGLIRTNVGATWNNSSNSNITVNGGITHSGVTFASGLGVYTFNTNDQVLDGILTINNVTVTAITLTNSITLTASTTLSGTGTLLQASAATLNIGGTSLITGLDATTNSGNTVNYTAANQTVNPTNYFHLILSGSGVKTLQSGTSSIAGDFTLAGTVTTTGVVGLTIGGDFVLGSGTKFTSGAFTHNVGGNWINNGTNFVPGLGTINFDGTVPQTIGGTAATTFRNLIIDNPTGISLDDGTNSTNKIVTGALSLSNGYLTTNSANLMILNNGASAIVASAVAGVPQSNSPYVNGPMDKIGNQAFIFPVGSLGTGCVPIGISSPVAPTDAFHAQYNRSSAKALGPITAPNLTNVSICEYWTLDRTVGASTVNVTAYWNANNPCNGEAPGKYVSDFATIALAHFNGTSWDNSTPIPAMTNGTTITGSVTWLGVSTFSPFALGNNNTSRDNPLDIKMYYFTAVKANGYNILSWKAQCTTSSNLFEAQRSTDGANFVTIDSVKINAAPDCSQGFTYDDYSGSGNKIYYRIKTTDVSGTIGYSEIKLLTNQVSTFDFISVSPNPAQGNATLMISALQNDHMQLSVFGIDGRELLRQTLQVPIGTSTINLQTSALSKGIYLVKGIFSGGQTTTIKLVKQ